MESKPSEPREGENIIYSHTPDGHERAGPRPAAVVGSDSGTELRSVPAIAGMEPVPLVKTLLTLTSLARQG